MKYAFVTGSTKGIGKAIGIKLLQEGYFVIFNYSTSDKIAQELRELLSEKFFDRYIILKANLSQFSSIDFILEGVEKITSKLDVIVFNTGITDRSLFGEITQENWLNVFNTNLHVPFFLLQSLNSKLNKSASVVFIGSMLGNLPHSVSLSYGVSKSAIHALVKNMVKFLSHDNVRINAIAPGFVDTDWQKDKPDWLREKIKGKIALKRFAKEEEVADLCFHIIQNKYLTGQIIQLDGGYSYK